MKMAAHTITTCLWFDTQAEQAANSIRLDFRGCEDRKDHPLRKGGAGDPRQGGRVGHDRGVRDRRADVRRPQRWPALQVQRSRVVPGALRDAAGDRLFLEQARRGRRGRPLRLAEGQVRRLLAGRPDRTPEDAGGRRRQEVAAGDQGLPADEEVRHRRARARRTTARQPRRLAESAPRASRHACTRRIADAGIGSRDGYRYTSRHRGGLPHRAGEAHRRARAHGARRRRGRGAGAGRARRRARAVAEVRHPRQARRLADGRRQAPRASTAFAAPSWSTASTPSWGTSWRRTARRRCPISTPRSTTTSATTCCG